MDDKKKFSNILEEQTRSDELLHLREIMAGLSDVHKHMGNAIQLRIVVDTNVILKDLIFLSKNARQAEAKTGLQEAMAAGTIIAHAPLWLCDEVEKHIPSICEDKKISLDVMEGHWDEYRKNIQFFDIAEERLAGYADSVDPKDAPFIELEKEIDAFGILSDDSHIENMGGTRITLDVIVSMRDYSRHSAIEFKIKYMGVMTGTLSIKLITAIFKSIGGVFQGIKNLPKPVLYALLAGAVWVILDPKMRTKVMDKLRGFGVIMAPALGEAGQLIAELSTLSASHAEKARSHQDVIEKSLIKLEE